MRIPLLLSLRERGFDVAAVGSEKGNAFGAHNIPYYFYSLKRGINPLADLRCRQQLYKLFSEHKPDIIHTFDTKPAFLAPIPAQKAGVPVCVRTITGMGYIFSSSSVLWQMLRPIYRYLQTQAAKKCDVTVFQNSTDQRYFREHGMLNSSRDVLVLGSGLDISQFTASRPSQAALDKTRVELGIRDGTIVVTMVSRIVKAKGIAEFINAAEIVKKENKSVSFLLVGPVSSEGRQAFPLQEIERKKEYVNYVGPRKDIPTILGMTDIFVLPSYYREGIPRVLLEAGACGLPLITTDMPGCNEVVRDGWNGYLIPIRDSTRLAEAISTLSKLKDERILMGDRSKQHVLEHFTLGKVADAYSKIYNQINSKSA